MRNYIIFFLSFLFTALVQAQEKSGSIVGQLRDLEMNNEPLPFANVLLKNSTKGATTDMEGFFSITNLEPGTYTVVFSFVGYESLEIPNVEVAAGKVTEINTELGAGTASLDEVVITTVARKDSEVALLLEQKAAIEIKESIGAQQLAKMGVSDVATATAKIAGVTTSEASGDLFVRGLGDRYLYTTLNGLPIPSDDVERKNIDLGLFSTRILQNISVSKTFSATHSADQSSGTINITSRELAGASELDLGVKAGINSNVVKKFNGFKVSASEKNVVLGFYNEDFPIEEAIKHETWDPKEEKFPINRSYSLTAGTKLGEKLRMLFTGSQSTAFKYSEGLFREYRSNNLYDYFSDVQIFTKINNTTGLFDLGYRINDDNRLQFSSLFINKLTDEVYESGRNAEGVVFEETGPSENLNQFVRDQNLKQTRLWVNQLHGYHDLSEFNELEWAVGYNLIKADEPNRIRNELNIDGEGFIQFGRMGGFQQRKSSQMIDDKELNALVLDRWILSNDTNLNPESYVEMGVNFRNKERDFISKFFGVTERGLNVVNPSSLDDISDAINLENFDNGNLRIRTLTPDMYFANLLSYAAFANINYSTGKWNFNLGARYQKDELEVAFDVNNYPSNLPQFANKAYGNVYPTLNIKYSPTPTSNLRLAASRTITLPEFKEIAPFEYVSQSGQITRGNPNLEASNNLNFDVKYEFFPSAGQLISFTGFYKNIDDPINRVQDRGAAGVFSFFNAGEEANVYGLELGANLDLIDNIDPKVPDLSLGFNATRMWHEQDLKNVYRDGRFIRTFQYNNKEEVGLQGASNWILNASINLALEGDNPLQASIVANYASDKIFALGAPEIQTQTEVFYNDEIVEKGFVVLDVVLNQDLGEHWGLQLKGQNLLNPHIERVQNIRPSTTGVEAPETVRSYTTGSLFSLGISYSF